LLALIFIIKTIFYLNASSEAFITNKPFNTLTSKWLKRSWSISL